MCSSTPQLAGSRLNGWELESPGISFAHVPTGSCLPSVRSLGSSPVFLCVVPLWATLGFLMAWGLRSTGDPSKDPEPGPEREEEEKKKERGQKPYPFF